MCRKGKENEGKMLQKVGQAAGWRSTREDGARCGGVGWRRCVVAGDGRVGSGRGLARKIVTSRLQPFGWVARTSTGIACQEDTQASAK